MMDDFDATAVSYQIVLTKTDKLKRGALNALIEQTQTALQKRPPPIPTSSPHRAKKATALSLCVRPLQVWLI